jgi:hypothetical protein
MDSFYYFCGYVCKMPIYRDVKRADKSAVKGKYTEIPLSEKP